VVISASVSPVISRGLGSLLIWIIKEYAYTNSITEVVKRANAKGMPLDQAYAKSILKGKAGDELHRMLRSGYLARLKPKKERLY
jgi:hypothetical protein